MGSPLALSVFAMVACGMACRWIGQNKALWPSWSSG